jgi:hypothetical protein
MDIRVLKAKSMAYVVVDNFFTPEEYERNQRELLYIQRFADTPETTGTARRENNQTKKNGRGVFLDELYTQNRSKSDILNSFNKVFDQEFIRPIVGVDSSFLHLRWSVADSTLVNYYGSGGYYEPHRDICTLSALWFDQIGIVTGGEFVFPEHDVVIEPKPNRLVLFHGCTLHGANVVMAEKDAYRISVAKFIGYK